jgi:hypothetical protein
MTAPRPLALVDGRPGPHSTWEELADHSVTGDHVEVAGWAPVRPVHWHLASGGKVAAHVRLANTVAWRPGNPLHLYLRPCTAPLLGGRQAGQCEAYAAAAAQVTEAVS